MNPRTQEDESTTDRARRQRRRPGWWLDPLWRMRYWVAIAAGVAWALLTRTDT